MKNLAKAQQEYQDALKASQDGNMGKKQAKEYIQPFLDALNVAQSAFNSLGISDETLANYKAYVEKLRADINDQMTPQKDGNGGGGSAAKSRTIPKATSAE